MTRKRWLIFSVAVMWTLLSVIAMAQCTPDAYEDDDACIPSKAVIYGGDTQSHNFCQDAEDWINFNACTGQSYTIETSNLGLSADTVLELYDTDCSSLLLSDDNGGAGLASLIAGWVAPADGTYHIKALQFGGKSGKSQEYDITLTGDTSPCSTWVRTYGSANSEYARSIQQTTDGGFVVAGLTTSFGAGDQDFWVLKLDVSGNVQWEKTYGGTTDDWVASIQQTTDGGFIVAGYTESFGEGSFDFWVLKLNASGNVEWQKTYGGTLADQALSIQQTSDNGFVVAGRAQSFGAGSYDFWVLKLGTSGNVEWEKTYGGAGFDYANSVQQTTDGGYVVAGQSNSFGGNDAWILKLDASGNVEWENTYGGASNDLANSIRQTADGGFIVAAGTVSFSADDMWVLKLSDLGVIQWQKTYGGAGWGSADSVQQTSDGGFAVAGFSDSFGAGGYDFWVLKLDALGGVTWQKTYGDAGSETGRYIQQAADGGFAVAGETSSFGAGSYDVWVLKLDANGSINPACPIGADTFVTGLVSPGVEAITSASVAKSKAAVSDTSVTGVDSAAVIDLECVPYLIYDSHAFTDCGNADGVADPGETIDLDVTVQNTGGGGALNASGVLSTTTPGIVLTVDSASFPDIPVGLTGTSLTPFQFIVDAGVPCGTVIDFTLDLSYEDSYGGSFSGPTAFQLQVGSPGAPVPLFSENFNSGLPATWTVINGGDGPSTWTDGDPCARGVFPDTYMICDNECAAFVVMDEDLITPLIDASAATAVELRFEHDFLSFGMGVANVRAKSTKTGGWVTLATWAMPDAGTVTLDATAECAGETDCQFEWSYGAFGSFYWAVDNVVVEDTSMVCNPSCCGLSYVAYDTTFDPAATLVEACGDGDLLVEPGEEWQATVQLRNVGCVTANNTVADLTVNAGSAVAASICNNPGTYGNVLAGATAQFTYSFVVDSLAVCVNDVTFDVTGIASDEGAYASEIPAFTVQVGRTTGGASEVRAQLTDPLDATGVQATSDFAPDFTLAAPAANAELSYTLSYAPIPGGNEVGTTGANAKAKGAIAEEPFAPAFTLTGSAASAVVSYTLTHQKGEPDLTNCTATWIVRPDATTALLKNFGVADAQPYDVPGAYTIPGTYSIRLEENCGSGNAQIEAGAAFDVTEVDTGNATDNAQVELIDPSLTATIVKDYGAADPLKPIDVTAYYTGPGTYRIRLSENAGGTATVTGGVLDVTDPITTECDASACACPAVPPSEPSPPGALDPLIIPTTAADQIIVENVANETGYVVYENAIGTWYGTPSQGCMSGGDIVDLGATVQLDYPMAVGDRWVVVSSANTSGESSCGMDSAAVERNTAPGWPPSIACP